MQKDKYYAYGETIESDFEFEELIPAPDNEEVTFRIKLGKIPKDIYDIAQANNGLYPTKEFVCFYMASAGYFLVEKNGTLTIETDAEYDAFCLKTYVLGSAFGFFEILNGKMPIHGSTVTKDGKNIIITGESGSGKSTISTLLRSNGFSLVADDVSVIDGNTDLGYVVIPGFPQVRLCADTAARCGYDTSKMQLFSRERNKYSMTVFEEFVNEYLPLKAIYFMVVSDNIDEDYIYEELVGQKKLECIFANVYRGFVYKIIGMDPAVMKAYLDMVKDIPIYIFVRKAGKDTAQKIVSDIIKTFENH